MKKLMIIAMMFATVAAFAQMEITRNRVVGMVGLGYGMTDITVGGDDFPVTTMGLSVPAISYEFEAKPTEMFKMYLYADLGYYMDKVTVDGEDADPLSGSTLALSLDPMGKLYLPNNLFGKVELPFEYTSYTSAVSGAEAVPVQEMNAIVSFGYDTREVYVHGMTPWDKFEKGMLFYAFYDMGLMASVDGEAADELGSFFGVAGCYAHYADGMMVKPYVQYKMGMNDLVDENGYVNIGLDFVKDFSEKLNLDANVDFGMTMLPEEDLAGNSSYNELNVDAMVSYYVMPELAIGGGLGLYMDLTTEDANPVYMLMVGAEYTLNFIK